MSRIVRLAALGALALAACSPEGEEPTAEPGTCVPGQSELCACTDASSGSQVCLDDGTFAACVCRGGAAGGGGASGGGGSGWGGSGWGGGAAGGGGVPAGHTRGACPDGFLEFWPPAGPGDEYPACCSTIPSGLQAETGWYRTCGGTPCGLGRRLRPDGFELCTAASTEPVCNGSPTFYGLRMSCYRTTVAMETCVELDGVPYDVICDAASCTWQGSRCAPANACERTFCSGDRCLVDISGCN